MKIDVSIVGGGPSGLSAALVLGRCHRRALICDDGMPRNRFSHAVHGLLGHEGREPSALLGTARDELQKYPTLSYRNTRVLDIQAVSEGFEYSCADGTSGSASKLLLASGIVDELPEIVGVEKLYGISVHHCL